MLISALLMGSGMAAVAAGAEQNPDDVAFVAACDGSTQRYVVIWPEAFAKDETHDVLVALHGHGSDRWQFVKDPRDECRAARDAAAKRHMIYVSPDYRAATSWMGPKAESDVKQIIEDLKRHHRIGKVFLCGGSMGGTGALTFAVLHPKLLDGVAAMNPAANLVEYTGFPDAFRESYGGSKEQVPQEYRNRSAEFFPERLTMPVGITAGGKDDIVPAQSVVRLGNALKRLGRDIQIIYREDGGHATNYEDATAILEFVIEKSNRSAPSNQSKLSGSNTK
ncbi:MAG: alpha/beta fold hydrolase [Candidatus Hydrogenedentes bacterium]|nr:alpha/beta fold hydrolase [Candidatus Hydrogenedentota bacterium]